MKQISLLVIPALCLSGSALGQVSKQGDGYLFRTKYAQGSKLKYSMNMVMSMSVAKGAPVQNLSAPTLITVEKVDGKGNATLAMKVGPMVMNGSPMGQAQEAKTVVNTQGKVVEGPGMGAAAQFPDKAVKVGDTWTGTTKLGQMGMGGAANTKYTFKGIKNIGGKQVAEIAVSLTADNFAGKGSTMSGSGLMHVLVQDGTSYDVAMTTNMTMPAGAGSKAGAASGPSKMSMKMNMKRQ